MFLHPFSCLTRAHAEASAQAPVCGRARRAGAETLAQPRRAGQLRRAVEARRARGRLTREEGGPPQFNFGAAATVLVDVDE